MNGNGVMFQKMDKLDAELAVTQAERDHALMALEETQNKFRALSEAATEGIVIHRNGVLIAVNAAFQDLTGYSENELEAGVAFWDIIIEEDKKMVQDRMNNGDMEPYVARIRTKSGKEVSVYVRCKYVPYNGRGMCRADIIIPCTERS